MRQPSASVRAIPWPQTTFPTRLLLAAILALCVSATMNVSSAANEVVSQPDIQQLRIKVMPEFDDPRVLVIVQGRLATVDIALPAPVTFRVPANAQINQMAALDVTSGDTKSQPFEVTPDPQNADWSLVTYNVDNAHFFYEYYYNPLVGETEKAFTFAFSHPKPIADFLLEIQEPLKASDFAASPEPTSTRFDDTIGFKYHRFNIGPLNADEEAAVTVNYIKISPEPSVSKDQVMAMRSSDMAAKSAQISAMPPANLSNRANPHLAPAAASPTLPMWVFAVAGLLLPLSAAVIIWHRRRQPMLATAELTPATIDTQSAKRFCPQCGNRLRNNAHFCHHCGNTIQ